VSSEEANFKKWRAKFEKGAGTFTKENAGAPRPGGLSFSCFLPRVEQRVDTVTREHFSLGGVTRGALLTATWKHK
jgi:hypothetical protein